MEELILGEKTSRSLIFLEIQYANELLWHDLPVSVGVKVWCGQPPSQIREKVWVRVRVRATTRSVPRPPRTLERTPLIELQIEAGSSSALGPQRIRPIRARVRIRVRVQRNQTSKC